VLDVDVDNALLDVRSEPLEVRSAPLEERSAMELPLAVVCETGTGVSTRGEGVTLGRGEGGTLLRGDSMISLRCRSDTPAWHALLVIWMPLCW
jgi:hypothetical protein